MRFYALHWPTSGLSTTTKFEIKNAHGGEECGVKKSKLAITSSDIVLISALETLFHG